MLCFPYFLLNLDNGAVNLLRKISFQEWFKNLNGISGRTSILFRKKIIYTLFSLVTTAKKASSTTFLRYWKGGGGGVVLLPSFTLKHYKHISFYTSLPHMFSQNSTGLWRKKNLFLKARNLSGNCLKKNNWMSFSCNFDLNPRISRV